jgi:hypothetical protein
VVGPVVQVLAGCVAPVLVTCNNLGRIVCVALAQVRIYRDRLSLHW